MSTVSPAGLDLREHCSHLHGQDEKVREDAVGIPQEERVALPSAAVHV